MKKIFITFLLIFSMNSVFAENIPQPNWNDFVPNNANQNDVYWTQRKVKFNQSMQQCSPYSGKDLKSCYSQIKEAEKMKTENWNFRNKNR